MAMATRIYFFAAAMILLSGAALGADIDRVERGNLVLENIPEIPPSVVERLNQYQHVRSASFSGWLPDGGILITTRFADTTQAHRVRRPMGVRSQVTFLDEPVRGASVSPDASRNGFLYLYDIGGSEFHQIYWFDLSDVESVLLTDGSSRNGNLKWSNGGERFAYTSTRRDGRNFDIWIGAPENLHEQHEMVFESRGSWTPLDWSPDDRRLLLGNYISINESRIFVLDLESRELTPVNPSEERIGYSGGAFDQSGEGVYLAHDQNGEFKQLHHYDLASGRMTSISADIPWDVQSFTLSRDRARMAFSVNEGGANRLHLLDLESDARLPGPELPAGLIGGLAFSPNGERLAMTLSSAQSPGDVYVYELAPGQLVRWTESEVGGLDASQFPLPELISYTSFDGLEIPSWLYRPRGEGPHPVIVQIHGGPESQSRPGFSALYAYWVNEIGAALLRPNVRGSSGYGKTYLDLDNGLKREDSVRDIGALLDWIAEQPELDENRVIVYGGSYGGYMVLASLVHYDERLLGGINSVGISNFVTFLENTEAYRRDLRRVEYGDERDPEMREFLESISPLNNADRITSPLFVAQGLNDPRVPAGESEQIVRSVRENGGEVWYLLAKDEGHGFSRKANRDYFQAASVLFLRRLFE